MYKPRAIFTFVEAGYGHIMPEKAVYDAFRRKYGDKVECVESYFYTETDNVALNRFGWKMAHYTERIARSQFWGFFTTFSMAFWGVRLSTWGVMECYVPGARRAAIQHFKELAPDVVVSTHWSSNYYAEQMPDKPLTVRYLPDIYINNLDAYPCDLSLISNDIGYKKALTSFGKRYNEKNLKRVPFCIREEAFSVDEDKNAVREKLGIERDAFTVLLLEGGYGIGKTFAVCKQAIERDLPVTLVAVCGKNKKMKEALESLQANGRTKLIVKGFVENVFDYYVAADLMCGKSGASATAEPCYFGLPMIITMHASHIERNNASYYVDHVGNALNIFEPKKICDKIEELMNDRAALAEMRRRALTQRDNYGAEKAADEIFYLLAEKFPYLKDERADEGNCESGRE